MSELKCPFCQRKLKTFAKYKDGTSTLYCSKCLLVGDSKLFSELIRTRKALDKIKKENEDKQAVLNCVVDMLKTLNQRYALIMGKDVIKETVRLLEQKEVK